MKLVISLTTILISLTTFAQHCDGKQEMESLNTISKCKIASKQADAKANLGTDRVVSYKSRKVRFSVRKSKDIVNVAKMVSAKKAPKASFKKSIKIVKKVAMPIANVYTFDNVDVIPLFKGEKKKTMDENLKSFKSKIEKHIKDNFEYPELAKKKNIQGDVWVTFVIKRDGSLGNVTTSGNSGILQNEAREIVMKLGGFTPAEKDGAYVDSTYSVPVSFFL